MAPPTTVAIQNGRFNPAPAATLTAIGTRTEIVPQDVPIAIEMMQAIINRPGIAKLPGTTFSSMLAVLDAPPLSLAIPEKAPASRKINSIIVMLSSPIPLAQAWIFALKSSSLFCMNATVTAIMKATTTDIT